MRLPATIDRDEDGVWIVECPAIPGCVSQGSTEAEALRSLDEAIQLGLEVRLENGLPLTVKMDYGTIDWCCKRPLPNPPPEYRERD